MRQFYTALFYLLLPFAQLRLLWRSLKAPAYRRRWAERFGRFADHGIDDSIWIHAVSVGETQAVEPLVKRLLEQHPDVPLVITTTTPTGSAHVRKLFGDRVHHVYFPYDIPFAIEGFLARMRPRMLVMIETEIWPNLLAVCARRGIATILANARLSERSARGYGRLGRFTQETFGRIGLVAAQSPADAERFLSLGVRRDRVRVTGSIKFDISLPASLHEQAEVLRRQWRGRPVWVAASTHEGEDEILLDAHRQILKAHADALLVLVPRHPERFERVAGLCRRQGFQLARRSVAEPCGPEREIFLGDTMGELALFMAASDVAFVGGSLVPVGGHNILEPAALGVPILFGPHMFNFALISRMMLAADAAVQIANGEQLATVVSRWLGDASERSRVGENGRRVVAENRGALDRLYALIEEQL
jgi:3-deoxy-D-manno-octulosonic-acid transferase